MTAEAEGLPPHGESSVSMLASRKGMSEPRLRIVISEAERRSFDDTRRPAMGILRTPMHGHVMV